MCPLSQTHVLRTSHMHTDTHRGCTTADRHTLTQRMRCAVLSTHLQRHKVRQETCRRNCKFTLMSLHTGAHRCPHRQHTHVPWPPRIAPQTQRLAHTDPHDTCVHLITHTHNGLTLTVAWHTHTHTASHRHVHTHTNA